MPKKNRSAAAERDAAPARRSPLVFVSHDSRDAALAEAFELLLIDASGGVLRAFRSSDKKGTSGIEFGAEWYVTVMSKLAEATDVVALLTPNSLERPWILYEVGVARGQRDTPAFGVTFGVSLTEVTGPFQQLQNSSDDEDSLTKLVLQMIRRNPDATPREEAVRLQVAAFRDRLQELTRDEPIANTPTDPAAIAKLFEEIKVMFRQLPEMIKSQRSYDVTAQLDIETEPRHEWLHYATSILRGLERAPAGRRVEAWMKYVQHAHRAYLPHEAFDILRALREKEPEELAMAAQRFGEAIELRLQNEPSSLEEHDMRDYLTLGLRSLDGWVQDAKATKTEKR